MFTVSVRCVQKGWYTIFVATERQARKRLAQELARQDLTTTQGTIHNRRGDRIAYKVREGWS